MRLHGMDGPMMCACGCGRDLDAIERRHVEARRLGRERDRALAWVIAAEGGDDLDLGELLDGYAWLTAVDAAELALWGDR